MEEEPISDPTINDPTLSLDVGDHHSEHHEEVEGGGGGGDDDDDDDDVKLPPVNLDQANNGDGDGDGDGDGGEDGGGDNGGDDNGGGDDGDGMVDDEDDYNDEAGDNDEEDEADNENINDNDNEDDNDDEGNEDNNDSGKKKKKRKRSSSSGPKRRFFPRIKHLLTPEWEHFLQGILHSLETCNAHYAASASHKASNPWYRAFHHVYGGVAIDCSVPSGKNRYQKFKDKMIDLWVALELHHQQQLEQGIEGMTRLQQMAARQLETYRRACEMKENGQEEDMLKAMPPPPSSQDEIFGASSKLGSPVGKVDMQGGSKGTSMFPGINNTNIKLYFSRPWEHLDERDVLKKLPKQLRQLVHLRHFGAETQQESPRFFEHCYQQTLYQYLDSVEDKNKTTAEWFHLCQSFVLLWRFAYQLKKIKETKRIVAAYKVAVEEYGASQARDCDAAAAASAVVDAPILPAP